MLDIKAIRQNPNDFKKRLARKFINPKNIDDLLSADKTLRELLQKVEMLKQQQNNVSKEISNFSGNKKEKVLAEMKNISEKRKTLEIKLHKTKTIVNKILSSLPNPPHEKAPNGKDDTENVIIKTWGKKPKFDFEPKDHAELGELLGIIDTHRATKVSGARFYYLRNELALLQRALIFWAFTEVAKKGFSPTIPPFMTRADAIRGTGFFDKDENYCVNPGDDDLYLIGTSEVPMTSYYADEILEENTLPQKFVAYSPCFRKEAGSYGKDTKGIFRVHQFEKVEMVIFCAPEDDEKMHELIRDIEEELLQKLEIPYQVVNVCTGDLGNSAIKKYDLEAWLPGQNAFREMTSTSICTDFQTRRLKIRMRKKDGTIVFAHTLNGTAVSSRPLIAIMENFQQADGSILIPKILQPFCGFDKIKAKETSDKS
ncbi:serine--tRNA ligase [Candidatus Gracilibacteria bacterium]|nr:serine--tRNA ligase [Candidatus Gracilibacteria bacterium]